MKIRFGTYTLYENIEMLVSEYYGHGLDQDVEMNHRIISYSKEYGQLEGFVLDEKSNRFKKDSLIKDLKNAFFVITKVLYKEYELSVWAFNQETEMLTVYTDNEAIAITFDFIKLSDRFVQEIKIADITKIWEERRKSIYDVPMPENIELTKIIEVLPPLTHEMQFDEVNPFVW